MVKWEKRTSLRWAALRFVL